MRTKVLLKSIIALSLSTALMMPGASVHAQQMTAEEYWATANTTDNLYYEDVRTRVDTIMTDYLVPGRYWNHVGLDEWDQFTTTDKPCPDTVIIDGVEYPHNWGGSDYEKVYEYSGCSTYLLSNHHFGHDGGFTYLLHDGIFGESIGSVSCVTLDDMCIGDLISEPYITEKGEHVFQWYTVVDISDDDITLITCNPRYHSPYSTIAACDNNPNCLIFIDHWSLEKFKEVDLPTAMNADVFFNQYYIQHNIRNHSNQTLQNPDYIEGKNCSWNSFKGKYFWYENSLKQGTYNDPQGILGDGTNRGREIYDSESNGWYWLDSVYDGAKAEGKEVWIPYIYQEELALSSDGIGRYANGISDEAKIHELAQASNTYEAEMADQVEAAIRNHTGKWVRYDENGAMLKGWVTIEGALAECYPNQRGNVYYYDQKTGLMAKGWTRINGVDYYFDEVTGVLQK